MTRRQALAALALPAVAALLMTGAAPAGAAAAADTTMTDIRLADAGPGLTGGYRYTVLTVELDLADPDGLPDTLTNFETEPYPVVFAEIDREGFLQESPSDTLPEGAYWSRLDRVSGTPTSGTWRGSLTVGSVSTGRVGAYLVVVTDVEGDTTELELADGPTVDVATSAASQPWAVVPTGSVRVVTGQETWRPTVRLTTRAGAPVGGAMTYAEGVPDQDRATQTVDQVYPAGSVQPSRARFPLTSAPDGTVLLPASYPLSRTPQLAAVGGWGSGASRYHTLMAVGFPTLVVKWQARSSFAAAPGGVITLSGNAWPAPSIYRAANPNVHLQRLVGRTWRTEATGTVRANGRYTVVWDAPEAAGYWVRAYKPGGSTEDGLSAGTTGPAVWVATP